ncbi:MAG: hypothetical protein KAS38_10520 [Anaerolineales bacterium]|nr:hypothetical protein [Anaerolineales bacterium]
MVDQKIKDKVSTEDGRNYIPKYMELHQISMIDEALGTLGDYGEVRLIVEKGRLRFLVTQKSYDALKWQPGYLSR